MNLSTVLSIDPNDVLIQEVASLAASFGILEMTDVVTQLELMRPDNTRQFMFLISEETVAEVIATLLSLVIINYGTWKHEEIYVSHPSDSEGKPIRFYRELSADTYLGYGEVYLVQAKSLIAKYFPEN